MLNVIANGMPNAFMLSVVMLNVAAPPTISHWNQIKSSSFVQNFMFYCSVASFHKHFTSIIYKFTSAGK